METPSPPHRAPSSVWFYNHFSLSVAWGFWTTFRWRVELKQKTSGVDKSIGTPLQALPLEPPPPPSPQQCFSLPCLQAWVSGAKHNRARPTPSSPQFFTPLSASLEQNMSGPAKPSSDFYSLWQPQAYSSEGLWACAPPSPPWGFTDVPAGTFVYEYWFF